MTLTIEVDAKTEQTLEAKAQQRGVSVQVLLREIVESYTQNDKLSRVTAASVRGKYAGTGDSVDSLLRERREEAEREIEYSKRDFSKSSDSKGDA